VICATTPAGCKIRLEYEIFFVEEEDHFLGIGLAVYPYCPPLLLAINSWYLPIIKSFFLVMQESFQD